MKIYDVQISTDMDEYAVLQVYANDAKEAEMLASNMVKTGEAGTQSHTVVSCLTLS